MVERCFNLLKQFRGLATRYDKTATSYTAAVTIASLLLSPCRSVHCISGRVRSKDSYGQDGI
ncbi:hypothetical protein [Nonomuraea sp. NPDC049695]|uniref:hypothetical protein n=1 Tax=Nonomuraea sp. NPDC049695 TaxID=3154734 RepID=UPI00344674D1